MTADTSIVHHGQQNPVSRVNHVSIDTCDSCLAWHTQLQSGAPPRLGLGKGEAGLLLVVENAVLAAGDTFKWRLSVRAEGAGADEVEAVTYALHPSFKQNVVRIDGATATGTATARQFESKWYGGWGECDAAVATLARTPATRVGEARSVRE